MGELAFTVKTIVRPNASLKADVHVYDVCYEKYENPIGNKEHLRAPSGLYRSAQIVERFDTLRIHHYMTRSLEEWSFKVGRGRADRDVADYKATRDAEEFSVWDRNEESDFSALRFSSKLRKNLQK